MEYVRAPRQTRGPVGTRAPRRRFISLFPADRSAGGWSHLPVRSLFPAQRKSHHHSSTPARAGDSSSRDIQRDRCAAADHNSRALLKESARGNSLRNTLRQLMHLMESDITRTHPRIDAGHRIARPPPSLQVCG
jgi:hypothetical protein